MSSTEPGARPLKSAAQDSRQSRRFLPSSGLPKKWVFSGDVPLTFRYKRDREKDLETGFIAEDVSEPVATPDRKGASAMDIVGILTRVVQEQHRVVQEQRTEMDALEAELAGIQTLPGGR